MYGRGTSIGRICSSQRMTKIRAAYLLSRVRTLRVHSYSTDRGLVVLAVRRAAWDWRVFSSAAVCLRGRWMALMESPLPLLCARGV